MSRFVDSPIGQRKVQIAFAFLLLAASVAVGVTWLSAKLIGNRLAAVQAEQQADVWQHNGRNILSNGTAAFTERRVVAGDADELFSFLQTTDAFRIAMLDGQGKVFWSSRAGDIGNDDASASFAALKRTGQTVSERIQMPASKVDRLLIDHTAHGIKPSDNRETVQVYVPVIKRGEFLGAFRLHYDATDLLTRFHEWSQWTAAVVAGLQILFFIAIAGTVYSFARQRLAIEADLSEARDEAVSSREQLQVVNENVVSLNRDLKTTLADLRQAQDEIIRKGKMAQLGQLTATVAHDLRNPLGIVRTAAYMIGRKAGDTVPGIEKALNRIDNGVTRCDDIITELLDFARSKELQLETRDLDEWVLGIVREQANRLPETVALECHAGLAGQPVEFDPGKMQRALVNLLSNASEAMVGKTGTRQAPAVAYPKIVVKTVQTGRGIEVHVIDNGPGIPQDQIAKVMEPLFTTKSFGVGLGMPAVENILEQHNGGLEIKSKQGEGATMVMWLPARQQEDKAA